jgi:RNA polymerase sigma factor (TIGR02999 family)
MAGEVTHILDAIRSGDATPEELIALVYDELRRLASHQLSHEQPGQTLQPTALVHEAYLRLFGDREPLWENRRHFFGAAAEAMRRVLVESARRKGAQKRGGRLSRRELNELQVGDSIPDDELVAVDEALERLADIDEQAATLVKLRYFGGLTIDEAARVLGISSRTAGRLWAFARAWLIRDICDD